MLFHLAKAGVERPLLLDAAEQVGSGQTSRSTALVRTHYSSKTLTQMALLSLRFFKEFGANVPGKTAGFVQTGLLVGADASSETSLRENSEMHEALGIDSRLMRSDELVASGVEPALDASKFTLFAYEPDAGYAEPSTTASSFASAAAELGAEVVTGSQVLRISREPLASGGVEYSLRTTKGTIACRRVVMATGVWSGGLFTEMGVPLPLKVSRHPVAVFRRPASYHGTRPLVFDFPREAYYKPEGGELLFVGSFARQLDLGSENSDPDAYRESISFEESAELSRVVSEAIPAMADQGVFLRGYAGLYDNTPDQCPVLDELSDYGFPGVYCVVGLSGHGFKLAPEFGRIVASLVTKGSFEDYDVSVFRLKRFEEGRTLGGRYDVSTIL